jgi:hypothetical protein
MATRGVESIQAGLEAPGGVRIQQAHVEPQGFEATERAAESLDEGGVEPRGRQRTFGEPTVRGGGIPRQCRPGGRQDQPER